MTTIVNSLNSLNSHPLEDKVPTSTMLNGAYYGLLGDIVKAIEPHSEADPMAILIQMMSVFGNVIGLKPHFTAEADYHALKIYPVIVGQTSKGRKGTSWGWVRKMFKTVDSFWEQERIISGLASGEGLMSITSSDKDDKRFLVVETELANLFKVIGREGNTLSAVIRKAWESDRLENITKQKSIRAKNVHVSIIGHITSEELKRCLTSNESSNGFANRFMWILCKRSKLLPEGGNINEVNFYPLKKKLEESYMFAQKVGRMTRDDKARDLWCDIYCEASKEKPGLVGSLTARAEAYIMRLACIYALVDMCSIVKEQHLLAALSIWKYSEASVEAIFGDKTGNNIEDAILESLSKMNGKGLSRTDISNIFSRHSSPEKIEQSLDNLSEQGKVRYEIDTSTGGRPKQIWYLCSAK